MVNRKISIVGPHGFIGQHLVSALSVGASLELYPRSRSIFENDCEVRLSQQFLESDVIFWLASSVTPRSAEIYRLDTEREQIQFRKFVSALESSHNEYSSPKVVYLSSGGCIYTEDSPPFDESRESAGLNAYGKHKKSMEELLQKSKLNHLILRVANIYGSGQPIGRGQGVIAEWVNSISENLPINVFGRLDLKRDFLYIDDLVSALRLCVDSQSIGIINIGSGYSTSLEEIKMTIELILGRKLTVNRIAPRTFDRLEYYLDISKAKLCLSWEPKVTLKQGLTTLLKDCL